MGKITCLTSMFTRKGKLKVITPAECIESDSIWESSQKILLSKDSDNLSEGSKGSGIMSKDDSPHAIVDLTVDDEKPLMSSGSISKKLLSVPSIAEWAKHEKWTEQNGPACPDVSKMTYADAFEFDTKGLNVMSHEEAAGVHEMPVVIATEVGGGVAEVAYEGDEDEEFEKAEDFCIIQIEHQSEGSASGELSPEENRSGSSADNGTATHYEFHSNMARGSNIATSQFDEGAIGDYVSDPGVYHDDNSRSGPFDEDVEDDEFHSQSQHADHILKKARSEGGLYDLGLISQQQDQGQSTDKDLVPVSRGSPSYLNVSRRDFSILVPKSVLESSHSEVDPRDSKDLYLNVSFPGKGSSELKQKPWWKMFLISHRNIHRERNSLMTSSSLSDKHLLSGATGYSSDIDYYSGSPKLDLDTTYPKSDVHHPDSVLSGSCHKIGEGVEYDDGDDVPYIGAATDETNRDEGFDFQDPPLVQDNSGKGLKVSELERPDLKRVEEWISSIDPTPFLGDEEADIVAYSDTEPSAPAASFFRAIASRSDQIQHEGNAVLERRNHQGDQVPDADSEMASFIARSVNPLSTVAHFSGVGLKQLPPLGVHNNLKTLNLSANAIVRIVPGCLPRSLHSLDLSRNKIAVIEGFRDLSRLRVLNLSHNRILRIGHGLANCTSLRELHMAGNKISEVEGLHRLLKLSFIDLGFNKLASGKSIGQLAANYSSLQAINLLGNPLHSNLGEEPLRKLITGIAPHVVYLNKQATKAVSARDATVDSVARAALASSSHHTHQRGKTSSQSKPLRRNGKSAVSSVSSPRQRDKRSGERSATGHGSRSSALKNKAPELPPRHRHSQSRHVHATPLIRENSRLVPPVSQ
ncbi:hypothetical protein KC19_VG331600 [Ceratodon purpureus]|uniref:Uncharacterized protein n=1 Tax=Ceratodon purpureus TaxID=3225 RepID=A0A8T0HW39_CERPU|nr:hypothetical protein KC19_VG331600 [Ceratodon purpureus]